MTSSTIRQTFTAVLLAALGTAPLLRAQGAPPGGTSSSSVTYYATYELNGGAGAFSNQSYSATASDTSAVWVTNSGVLSLISPTIATSGNTSSTDNSSFYGLNAALLASAAGSITVTGGAISTTGQSANGAFATGTGSSVSLTNTAINCTADGAHGVMASQAGSLVLSNVTIDTAGGSAAGLATDQGGGTVSATGGTVLTAGANSPGIYSTGSISATGTAFKATGAEMVVIEGSNSVILTNSNLTGTFAKWGMMIYQSMSGDASGDQGTVTMTGGSLNYTPTSGPLFYITNATGIVSLKGVTVTSNSGSLVSAAAGDWGTSGSNGGIAVMTFDGETLTGSLVADSISSISATLKNGTTLAGQVTNASLTLDSTSVWNVTANSTLTSLGDSAGISGTTIANIKGNGYTVTYNSSLSANSYLGGKTYTLANGGTLTPAGSSTTGSVPSIASGGIVSAASGVAGVAPASWVSIFGSNLSTSTATAGSADLVNGYLPTTLGGATVTIDSKPAYIDYVSPSQINVEAPADSTTGSVTVTVTTASGSASAIVTMQAVLPGLFTSSNYVLAVRPSDDTVINGTGATVSGYTTSASAKPGDVLEIFATGLGSTTTSIAPGLVFSAAYATTNTPTVTIGGAAATVSYSGLIGAGLYQINITVPSSLAAGTYPIVVTQSGVSSPSTAILKVAGS